MSPASRRKAVEHACGAHYVSERRDCRLVGLARSVWSYPSVRREPEGFRQRMRKLAKERPRFGCPRIHIMLRREGFDVNHKRTHRIYVEEKLQIRRRRKRKVVGRARRESVATPSAPHVRWSMDFVSDGMHDGRAIAC